MAMPIFPPTIKLSIHYYLLAEYPESGLTLFEHRLIANDPDWIYAFSHEVEVPVPAGLAESILQQVNPTFDAAIVKINAAVGEKINAIEQMRSKFLSLENGS